MQLNVIDVAIPMREGITDNLLELLTTGSVFGVESDFTVLFGVTTKEAWPIIAEELVGKLMALDGYEIEIDNGMWFSVKCPGEVFRGIRVVPFGMYLKGVRYKDSRPSLGICLKGVDINEYTKRDYFTSLLVCLTPKNPKVVHLEFT